MRSETSKKVKPRPHCANLQVARARAALEPFDISTPRGEAELLRAEQNSEHLPYNPEVHSEASQAFKASCSWIWVVVI